jgi:hypothetical protein
MVILAGELKFIKGGERRGTGKSSHQLKEFLNLLTKN